VLVTLALVLALVTPSPAPSPTSPPSDIGADATLFTPHRTYSIQTSYVAASYGPGSRNATQIVPRIAAFYLGKSLLRISVPRFQTINGVDSSFGDMQFFYLISRDLKPNGRYAGIFAQVPTGTGPLTTSKWLLGPAFAYVLSYVPNVRTVAVLVQTAFSVAGPRSAANQSAVTILPAATVSIGHGWILKWPESPWVFDLQRGSTLITAGLGIGRTARIDGTPAIIAISDEVTVVHANTPQAPKHTIRLYLTFVLPNPR
jgi:hypothetical protein